MSNSSLGRVRPVPEERSRCSGGSKKEELWKEGRSCRKARGRALWDGKRMEHRQQEAVGEPSRVQSMLSAWLAIFVICRRRKFPGQEVSPIHNHHACVEHVDSGMTDRDKAPWWSVACQTRLTGNKLPIFSLTKARKHRGVFSTQWKFEYDYDILLINVLHIH